MNRIAAAILESKTPERKITTNTEADRKSSSLSRCLAACYKEGQCWRKDILKREVGIFSFGYWGWGSRVPELKRRFLRYNNDTRSRGIIWVDIRIWRAARAKGFNGHNPER